MRSHPRVKYEALHVQRRGSTHRITDDRIYMWVAWGVTGRETFTSHVHMVLWSSSCHGSCMHKCLVSRLYDLLYTQYRSDTQIHDNESEKIIHERCEFFVWYATLTSVTLKLRLSVTRWTYANSIQLFTSGKV